MSEKKQKQDQTTDGVQEALSDRESKIEQNLADIRKELTSIVPSVRELIEKRPIGSALTALGAGLLVGYLIAGGQNRRDSEGDLPF